MPDDMMGKIQEMLSDEESMKQLSELAKMFSSSENNNNNQNKEMAEEKSEAAFPSGDFGLGDIDITKLFKVQEIMSKASNDKSAELLLALKPLLREERRAKVDKAVKILKLFAVWTVLKDSGLLSDFI